MAIDPTALKAEIDTDPEGLIPQELKAAGATRAVAELLNAPRANADMSNRVQGYPVEFTTIDSITGGELNACIDADEYDALSIPTRREKRLEAAMASQSIPITKGIIKLMQQIFDPLNTGNSPTLAALGAKIYTPKSRAQLLWGDVSVSKRDIQAALSL